MKKINMIPFRKQVPAFSVMLIMVLIINASKCDRDTNVRKCSDISNTGHVRACNRSGPQIYGEDSVFLELVNISFNIESFEGNKNIRIRSIWPEDDPPHYCDVISTHYTKFGSHLPADPFGAQAYRGVVRIFWEDEETGVGYSSYGAAHIIVNYYVPYHPDFTDDLLNNLECYQSGDRDFTSCMKANIKMYNPFPGAEPDIVVTGKCVNFALPDMQEFTYDFENVEICANYKDPYFRYPVIYPVEGRHQSIPMTDINHYYFHTLIDKGTFPVNEVSLYYKFPGKNFQKKAINDWRLLLDKGIVRTEITYDGDPLEAYYWEVNYGGDATDIIQSENLTIALTTDAMGSYFEYFEHLFTTIYTDQEWGPIRDNMCSTCEFY